MIFSSILKKSKKTALFDLHKSLGGKITNFHGWELPMQFSDHGILDSCLHTRQSASLFDVSHMGQIRVYGANRAEFLESIFVSDLFELQPGNSKLSIMTNNEGGILDDAIITNKTDHLHLVVNAGCFDKDLGVIQEKLDQLDGDVRVDVMEEQSLLALQGPKSATVLQAIFPSVNFSTLPFMSSVQTEFERLHISISRSGYTGEDGFEISVPDKAAVSLAEKILKFYEVKMAGLAARDVLRIEAGLCLYGQDIDETTTPVEAGMAWVVGKRRRKDGKFPGDDIILNQMKSGVSRRRAGLIVSGPPAREGCKIFQGDQVGVVTSGTFSPTLGKPVAMGYVKTGFAEPGSQVEVIVRDKSHSAEVTKLPFVTTRYFKI